MILISSPLKSGRKLPNGREITAEDSKKIWDTLVSHLPNVEVQVSPHASPITATYEFIGEDGPVEPGTDIFLGVCKKGKDVERFNQAERYIKEGVRLMPVHDCAIEPISHSSYYMDLLSQSPLKGEMPSMGGVGKDPRAFHASDMRYLLGKAEEDEEAIELLEDFTGEDNVFDVLSILGLNTGLNEISAMAVGSVEGHSAKKKKKMIQRQENMDLSMVDEILTLIMERGVLR